MYPTSVSAVHQDYLKAIYMLGASGQEASNSAIAEAMAVAPASATNMVKRLAEMDLIEYRPYRGVRLTPVGEQVALETIRHHRLLELFLHEVLEIPWEKVHAEAEKLEHAISEEVEEAIARKLGYPSFDPHGDPIPARDGSKALVADVLLSELPPNRPAFVTRVLIQEEERLRYLGDLGITPGASLTVVDRVPFEGPLIVRIGGRSHVLAFEMAEHLRVAERAN
ncbi:MAG: metal-dependent transcriptional regulator [Chloroflexota bacterium]|nr:metal-dependent transcriptional regulator [Chloroflexota bacterium]